MSQFQALYKKNYINWKRGFIGALAELLTPVISALILYMFRELSEEVEVPQRDYLKMPISLNPEGFSGTNSLIQDYKKYKDWTREVFNLPLFK